VTRDPCRWESIIIHLCVHMCVCFCRCGLFCVAVFIDVALLGPFGDGLASSSRGSSSPNTLFASFAF
jgi:hypothetical protein